MINKKPLLLGIDKKIARNILQLSGDAGTTKNQLLKKLGLSHSQIRRYTAEMIDIGLLKCDFNTGIYTRTDKGEILLKKQQNQNIDNLLLNAYDVGRSIISIDHKQSLMDARNIMLQYNLSRIVITKNKKPCGIITEKDIARFLYKSASNRRRLSEIPLKKIIEEKLITVNRNSSLNECAKVMLNNKISSIVITNYEGKRTEIITKTDLLEVYAHHYSNYFKVNEFMTKKVHVADPDEVIDIIPMLMETYDISRVIVAKNNMPIGIISIRDFLPVGMLVRTRTLGAKIKETSKNNKVREKFIPTGIKYLILVRDIMTSDPITIDENSDLSEAAKIMIRNRISGIPVINSTGKLEGIITKTDIIRAFSEIKN
ncbi:MAG: CBS domain-containing protein [Nitrososphaeraceae archaeon]